MHHNFLLFSGFVFKVAGKKFQPVGDILWTSSHTMYVYGKSQTARILATAPRERSSASHSEQQQQLTERLEKIATGHIRNASSQGHQYQHMDWMDPFKGAWDPQDTSMSLAHSAMSRLAVGLLWRNVYMSLLTKLNSTSHSSLVQIAQWVWKLSAPIRWCTKMFY